ncbi:uncharacterized protein BJ212DRAFT_1487369 [Suillus subaureus]|uniref:Uncharacterized protein n=1 Tax=Suillus subaureus TaxID=48587 RepID=A0A9P7DTD2_9AGAM|nr:uncharacterized protein BJ212DRAFT_1487369 [Suillus subaureus]KAG1802412.1 hypothetical protein BJ212DRAFT_1487369 [Suillus subaureus]
MSHKKKASQTLSVSLHESEPQNAKKRFSISSNSIKEWTSTGFESFTEWSKTKFYPSGDEDHTGSDNEDDENGPIIPEVILDDDVYAKLLTCDGIGLKGRHELIRSIFHASYKVCTVPTGFVAKDPSHMKTEKKLVRFIKAKDSDVHANIHNEEQKRKSKEKRHDNYLELIDTIRDLAILANQKPSSKQHADLPTWADWSLGGSYLPEDVHMSYTILKASLNKLQTFVISGVPSAMPVEDEAASNTPSYLPGSVFDLQFLVALDQAVQEVLSKVIEHIERLTKEALDEDDNIQDEGEVGNKETEMEVDQQEQEQE